MTPLAESRVRELLELHAFALGLELVAPACGLKSRTTVLDFVGPQSE